MSEYSQWNSGFALDQAMYPGQQRQHQLQQHQQQQQQSGTNSFMDSFFGNMNGGRAGGGSSSSASSSPYGLHQNLLQTYSPQHQSQGLYHQQQQHHLQQQQQQQMHPHVPLGQFDYNNFGALGNANSSPSPSVSSANSDITGTPPSVAMRSVGAIGSSRSQGGSDGLTSGPSAIASSSGGDSHSVPKQY